MSSDEKMNAAPSGPGRKVAFVGGPNAGQARVIPESVGEFINTGDYVYKIYAMGMAGTNQILHFAFDAQEHPIKFLFKMWEEYSIAAQIRGGDYSHIQRIGPDIKER